MRLSWTRSILLFSAAAVFATSCTKPEFSSDEPLIAEQGDNLYIVSEGNILYALDPKSGDVRWKYHDLRGIPYEPLAIDEFVFVTTPKNVLKLNAINGKLVDSIFTPAPPQITDYNVLGPVTGEGKYVFVPYELIGTAGGNFYSQFDHSSTDIPKQPVNFTQPLTATIPTTAITLGSKQLIPFSDKLSLTSIGIGAPIAWTQPGSNDNNPVTDGQVAYVCRGSELIAYDLNDGTQLWTFAAGGPINTSPIVFGRNVIFGSTDNNVYCIDPDAQAPRWVFKTNERIYSSPYAYDQTVYFGGNDHHFYAINIIDGSVRWKYRTGALIKSSPIVHDGTVYIGSYDLHLYAFDTSGALKWKRALNGLIDRSPVIYDVDSKRGVYPAISGLSTQ